MRMSFKLSKVRLKGLTHFKPAGNAGGIPGSVTPQNPDGGFNDRTSTHTYTGDTKVNTVYPTGTKIVTGEFDRDYPGFQDKTFTVTDTSTFNDFINAFDGFFDLSAVDAQGTPVDTIVDPTAPFYLTGHSKDGGSYDIVYVGLDGVQYHADTMFQTGARDRNSEFSFPFLGSGAPGGPGGLDGPVNERVGTVYLHRSDLLSNVTAGSSTRHIRLSFYVDPQSAPIEEYTFDVYGESGSFTVGDLLSFFSTRRSNLAATLQQTPGTSTSEEINNTEGYLHIQSSLASFTFNELDSDYIGFGSPNLFGGGL
jgi:hypothetical protein